MKKILLLTVVVSVILCGCGENIKKHESPEFTEQKKATVECLERLQKKVGAILIQWNEKPEYGAKDQEKFRDMIFSLDPECIAAVRQVSKFKTTLMTMDCPPKCDHLFYGKEVDHVGKSCESISKRGREILSGSLADIADKLERNPLKKINSSKSEITLLDRTMLAVLDSEITTVLMLLKK